MFIQLCRNIIACVFALLVAMPAFAAPTSPGRTFGLGLVLGEPSALTIKVWQDRRQAFQAGLAFAFDNYILLYGDYLYHFPGAFGSRDRFVTQLAPYLGVGGIFALSTKDRSDDHRYFGKSSGSFGLGVRVPLGIEWKPAHPPLGVFLEFVPGLTVVPATKAYLQGGIGIRYYF